MYVCMYVCMYCICFEKYLREVLKVELNGQLGIPSVCSFCLLCFAILLFFYPRYFSGTHVRTAY